MSKLLEKLPNIAMLALFAVSVVIAVLFWIGPSYEVVINGNPWDEPKFTNALVYWVYILCGLAVVITLCAAAIGFVKTFVASPKKGLVSLGVLLLFAAVFIVAWLMGSGETLNIIGYEGTDNQGFWARYSDMCCYTAYVLLAATICSIVVTYIYSKVK